MLTATRTYPDRLRRLVFAGISAVFIAVPAIIFAFKSPFVWHIKQPMYWQSSLELLAVLFGIYFSASRLGDRARVYGIVAVSWIYARHQGFDLSLGVCILYIQGISSLGEVTNSRLRLPLTQRSDRFMGALLMGFVLWIAAIFASSAIGLGSANDLRWLAVVLLGGAIVLDRPRHFAMTLATELRASKSHPVFYAVIGTAVLAALAKTTVAVDYDSLWYGLNGDHVLTAAGDMFVSEGLVAPVHYYPKVYEALLIPLSGLGSITLLSGFSAAFLAIIAVSILLAGRDAGLRGALAPAFASALVTLPAVANVAITTKGDVFALWLFVCGFFFAIRSRETQRLTDFALSLASVLLATQVRITEIPYAIVFSFILLAFAISRWRGGFISISRLDLGKSAAIVFAATAVIILATARTWVLAGVPLIAPDGAVTLAERLGFTLKFPVGRLDVPGTAHLPVLSTLWAYLFSPQKYTFTLISWTGNGWLLPFIAALFFGQKVRENAKGIWPLLVIGLLFPVLLLSYHWKPAAGADGNYFIVPIFSITLAGVIIASRSSLKAHVFASRALLASSIVGLAISLLTGSWIGGIREMDTDFTRTSFDLAERRSAALKLGGLIGEGKFFGGLPPGTRVIGEPDGWWLPVRYEPLSVLRWAKPAIMASPTSFREFLVSAGIQYILISKSPSSASRKFHSLVADLASRGELEQALVTDKYVTWRIQQPAIAFGNTKAGTIWITARQPLACTDSGIAGKVSLHWIFPDADLVDIYVQSASEGHEKPWSGGPGDGADETGAWATPGMSFIAKDHANGGMLASVALPKNICGN